MAAARKRCFLRFLYFTESLPPSFKVRGLQMTMNFSLVLVHISSRHSNLNFAHFFVIYWLFQNGANKNQHQDSYQRDTVPDKFIFFSKLVMEIGDHGPIPHPGCGMGPLLVLVYPCFWENVVATCKIGSFLCSLDNLLQKTVIVLFWKSNFKMALIGKKGYIFDLLLNFLVTRGKLQKFLQHISHSHTYTYFAHPIDFFCLTNFEKKCKFIRYGLSLV